MKTRSSRQRREFLHTRRRAKKEGFVVGWNEAVKEIAKAVADYKKAPAGKDPWEEWLPRLLDCLAETS